MSENYVQITTLLTALKLMTYFHMRKKFGYIQN